MPVRRRVIVAAAESEEAVFRELVTFHDMPLEDQGHFEASAERFRKISDNDGIDCSSVATTASGESLQDTSVDSLREFRGTNWL
jgi:hypothetical protein